MIKDWTTPVPSSEEVQDEVEHWPLVVGEDPELRSFGCGAITGVLGEGGNAVVYEVWKPDLEMRRAVKYLRPNQPPAAAWRFELEGKLSAKLSHPNIVEIHSMGLCAGRPFIEMEKLDGISLETLIRRAGALPCAVVSSIAIMVCRALAHAHRQEYELEGVRHRGIVHLDLKPANIMILPDGRAKLIDFGIAGPSKKACADDDTVQGSLQYLAPEQLAGLGVDTRSDIYALGAVLYEMIMGERAFPETDMTKLLAKRFANEYLPLPRPKGKTARTICALAGQCLETGPALRIQSVSTILKVLEDIHERVIVYKPEQVLSYFYSHDCKSSAIDDLCRRRFLVFPPLVIAGGGAAAVLAIAAVFLIARPSQPPPDPGLSEGAQTPVHNNDFEADVPSTGLKGDPGPALPVHSGAVSMVSGPVAQRVDEKANPGRGRPPEKKSMPASIASAITAERQSRVDVTNTRMPDPAQLLDSVRQSLRGRRYVAALQTLDRLPVDAAASPEALLYRLRAIEQGGMTRRLESFFASVALEDAEFLLSQARWLCARGDRGEALKVLEQSVKSPALLMSPTDVTLAYMLGRAECLTESFVADPQLPGAREAMKRWYEVKYHFRNDVRNPAYRAADSSIRWLHRKTALLETGGGD